MLPRLAGILIAALALPGWSSSPPALQVEEEHDLAFQMIGEADDPTTLFVINDAPYTDRCIQARSTLGAAVRWVVHNPTPIAHPFHIHTNPFQVLEKGSVVDGRRVPFVRFSSPLWQDTVAVPVQGAAWEVPTGPLAEASEAAVRCPGVCAAATATWTGRWASVLPGFSAICECRVRNNRDGSPAEGYVVLRQQPRDFTGEAVLHCHFLQHEDLGMMWSVDTVCPGGPPSYGTPGAYPAPECATRRPAGPLCPGGHR